MPKANDFDTIISGFTVDQTNQKVYCNICDRVRNRKWMMRRSVNNHLKTKEHVDSVQLVSDHHENMLRNQREAHQESASIGKLHHLPRYYAELEIRTQPMGLCVHESELYFDGDGNEIMFTAGDDSQAEAEMADLRRQMEAFEYYAENFSRPMFSNELEDITVTNVASELPDTGGVLFCKIQCQYCYSKEFIDVESGSDPEIEDILSENIRKKNSWFPYKNKTLFLLDMLDNLPRLRLSDAQMKAILFVMKESGSRSVPSLKTLRRLQTKLRTTVAIPIREINSGRGNVFHLNDITRQIAEDFSNPLLRPYLNFYPEDKNGKVYETWNAKKWCSEMPAELLTPMAIGAHNEHFYINELTRCCDKSYVLPMRWIIRNQQMCGDSYRVLRLSNGEFRVIRDKLLSIPLSEMRDSFLKLVEVASNNASFRYDSNETFAYNPLRLKAKGRAFYAVQLRFWSDDVSGNRSKQWNKHWLWCMAHSGLPKKLLNQEYFIRYICCSQNATVLEQADAICKQIRVSRNGIIAYDCITQSEVMFFINVYQLSGDNPMLSELTSHIGLNGNYFCYRCHRGGTKEYKVSDEGFHELFYPGRQRAVNETAKEVQEQLYDAMEGLNIEERQRLSGVKDVCAQHWVDASKKLFDSADLINDSVNDVAHLWLSTQEGQINPLLDLTGFDPHLDGPVEPLHTVLLGVVKYAWTITCEQLSTGHHFELFQARLTSVNTCGMNIPPIRANYLIQYRGALIGRQFKAIMQVMPFTLHGIVSQDIRTLWRCLGELGALLWCPLIENIEAYLKYLKYTVDNFLDALAVVDSNRIVTKPKCHILTHIVEDIRRYGPSVLLSTEMFEGFNGVWRLCSILSNHHAPSRDIAINLTDINRFKHIASGGLWKDGNGWVQAGVDVRMFLLHRKELQASLGWSTTTKHAPGYVQRAPSKKTISSKWTDTIASKAIAYFLDDVVPENIDPTSIFFHCLQLIAVNGDPVKPGNFVIAQKSNAQDVVIGKVVEILQSTRLQISEQTEPDSIVTLERYSIGAQHAVLKLPTIHQYPEAVFITVKPEHVQFLINVQHDCERSECATSEEQTETQERRVTSRKTQIVKHKDDSHFVVNGQALHNVHLFRAIFPHQLFQIPAISDDRAKLHSELATKLRVTKDQKAAAVKARRDAVKALSAPKER